MTMFEVEVVLAGNHWAHTIHTFGQRVNSVGEAVALTKEWGYAVLDDYPPEVANDGFEDALISVFVSEEGLA
jgi:hypothetical protein